MIRCKMNAFGRVQGVNYRFFVFRCAQELGITGYVKNLDDGSVEISAEAPDKFRMEQFKARIQKKSSDFLAPNVERLEVVEEAESAGEPEYMSFDIAH